MTDPFTAALIADLNGNAHAGKFRAVQGPAVSPKFFCCLSGNTVGVAKDPVPVISMSALVVCIGDPITLDYSGSWSPTDTLATWDIDWGDGQVSNGVWPGAGFLAHPLGGYVAAGKYTITLTLEDTIGAVNSSAVQVFAQDCAAPDEPAEDFPEARWANTDYTRGLAAGRNYVWSNDGILVPSVWRKVEANQLSASYIRDVRITRLPTGLEYLYVAREDGIYGYEIPPWGGTWVQLQTVEALITAAGHNPANYTTGREIQDLAFVETKPGWGYAWWQAWESVGLGRETVWGVAFTQNGWQSISYSIAIDTIALSGGDVQRFADGQVAVVQELGGQVAFASGGWRDDSIPFSSGEAQLYRTQNYGQSWSVVHQITDFPWETTVVVPHASQGYVYWVAGFWTQGLYRSTQYGAIGSFTRLSDQEGKMSVSPADPRYLIFEDGNQLWEHIPGIGLRAYGPGWPAGNILGFIVTERNEDNTVHELMEIGGPPARILMVYDTGATVAVTGAWAPTDFDTGAVGRPEAEEYLA